MTSKFLLHLSSDSIDLERMDASGHWHRLGSVSPDIENLSEALANLRQTAVPDAAGPLEVLVALPADQIKAFGPRPYRHQQRSLTASAGGSNPL